MASSSGWGWARRCSSCAFKVGADKLALTCIPKSRAAHVHKVCVLTCRAAACYCCPQLLARLLQVNLHAVQRQLATKR